MPTYASGLGLNWQRQLITKRRKKVNGQNYINLFKNQVFLTSIFFSFNRYQVIGKNHVAVPTHFYKVIVCETETRYRALIFVPYKRKKIIKVTEIETLVCHLITNSNSRELELEAYVLPNEAIPDNVDLRTFLVRELHNRPLQF